MINFSFGLQHQNCSHHSVSDVFSRPPFFIYAPVIGRWYFLLTLLQKDMSLCAPIQDNQVILVHMPPCISPPAPWPLSSAKSYLPPGLYRVFHSFIIYLQCPTDFSLRWHLTKKKLNGKIFQSLYSFAVDFEWILFGSGGGDGLWAALLQGHFFFFSPFSSRRLPFWACAPLSSCSNLEKKEKYSNK